MQLKFLSLIIINTFSALYAVPLFEQESCWSSLQKRSVSSYTNHCSNSFNPLKPIIEHVVIIDAGSSGSRIHIYKFSHCEQFPQLESEVFKSTTPGLSSYGKDPELAAKSLDVLLSIAVDSIPKELQACTPIAVKATAGLRLLGNKQSQAIIDAVKSHLKRSYPFALVDNNAIEVLDGKYEGVFGWITVNYLLGTLAANSTEIPVATFDLGGASTQIVFQPQNGVAVADDAEKYLLTINGQVFNLYQHSYLRYGLHEARKAIYNQTVKDVGGINNGGLKAIPSPCIPPGQNQSVQLETNGESKEYIFTGQGSPSAHECRKITNEILHKNESCVVPPCAIDGIHQPSFQASFPRGNLYLFSAFHHRTKHFHLPSPFALGILDELCNKICAGDYSNFTSELTAELANDSRYCLDLNYILSLLEVGYGIPKSRNVHVTQELNGTELGWTLGAALTMLEHYDCNVERVV